MWFISCPLTSLCKFYLFWFYCPPPGHKIFGCSGSSRIYGSNALVFAIFLAVVVADIAEYFIHLALHKVPFLWRFHAVHHSSKALDWIAGSRAHFVDDTLVARLYPCSSHAWIFASIILAYLIFVTIHATWTHRNFGPMLDGSKSFLVMPRYHHWHHTSQKEGIDKNFAIHFPWIDKLFGTYYYPDVWPERYGLDGEEIAHGFFGQTIEPFTIRKRTP